MSILEHDDLTVFYGPPGTGKTTSLLNVIERESQQVSPYKIGFFSFTRKAISEATERAMIKFNVTENSLPWFRTLHSLCYRALGLQPADVMTGRHYIELGKLLGVDITEEGLDPLGGPPYRKVKDGDKMRFIDQLARNRCVDLYEVWGELSNQDIGITWNKQAQFSATLKAYKNERGLFDYTDYLEQALNFGRFPQLDVIIADECQDLSTLQWKVLAKLASTAKRVYVAGDDDQGIYRWSGADVDEFINVGGKHQVLAYSYRLPESVYSLSLRVLARISRRQKKKFAPRDALGEVTFSATLEDVNFDQGQWLILARNHNGLKEPESYMIKQGYHYSSKGWDPVSNDLMLAIYDWNKLREGKWISGEQIKNVYKRFAVGEEVKRGFKTLKTINGQELYNIQILKRDFGLLTEGPWEETFHIGTDRRDFIVQALKRGERLHEPARIHLSTIHAAKGGEADHVALVTDVSFRCWRNLVERPDDEHRAFYVAITRARESLFVLQPQTPYHYDLKRV